MRGTAQDGSGTEDGYPIGYDAEEEFTGGDETYEDAVTAEVTEDDGELTGDGGTADGSAMEQSTGQSQGTGVRARPAPRTKSTWTPESLKLLVHKPTMGVGPRFKDSVQASNPGMYPVLNLGGSVREPTLRSCLPQAQVRTTQPHLC